MPAVKLGIYEQLITKLIENKLDLLDHSAFYVKSIEVEKEEASRYLSL